VATIGRAPGGANWDERCAALFEDLRKPARVMVRRAYGRAISEEGIDDVYASAWTSTLAALRGREAEMDDEELRSYLLTAVASHASKEMRRRSRRPTSALEDSHAQVLSDAHQPEPEERAVGAEAGSVARDLLASLPPRRRAVMLLRYGWGLEPKQVCSLVSNLSPRAYRKEITRGVEQMADRLKQVESGEWCESREPILRDYVAGIAAEEERRQALEHLGHCRGCSDFVSRLGSQLHELGGPAAWTALASALGEQKLAVGERLAAVVDRGREALVEGGSTARDGATSLATTGGTRGAGTAGAGALAKLAGLGAAGKAAIACLGAGVAATACLATGVVPGVGGRDAGDGRGRESQERPPIEQATLAPTPSVDEIQALGPAPGGDGRDAGSGRSGSGGKSKGPAEQVETQTAPEGAPASSPAPTAPPREQEFGLPAAAAPAGSASTGGGSGGRASGGDVAREFGP
jgi:RNA polymerase sigma factor (sigma-70 family)